MRVSGKTGFARLASPQCCPVRVQHILQLAPPVQVLAYMLAADPANKTGRVTSSLCNSRGHMFNEGIAALGLAAMRCPAGAAAHYDWTYNGLQRDTAGAIRKAAACATPAMVSPFGNPCKLGMLT